MCLTFILILILVEHVLEWRVMICSGFVASARKLFDDFYSLIPVLGHCAAALSFSDHSASLAVLLHISIAFQCS